MAPAWLLLIALACSALAQVSADCGKCATEECVSGGEGWARFKKCVCVPSLENCQGGTPITIISTQIQKAERCIDSVYSCALDEIKGYLPNLDTQICDTAESQRKFEEGDWKAYYGPRVWDSEALGTIIGLFFPATSALAAAKLDDELNKQVQGLEHALDTALDDAQDQVYRQVDDMLTKLFDDLLSGKAPDGTATLHVGKVGIKLSFLYIKCRLGLAGVKQTLPSEGYSRWAFGWRIDADARAGLRDLFDGVRSGGEAVHAPGLPDVEVQKDVNRVVFKNGCNVPVWVATFMAYPSIRTLPKNCMVSVPPSNGTAARWCLAGWWYLAPGRSLFIGQTTFRNSYYTARSTDGTLVWGDSSNVWNLRHEKCTIGSADCFSWKSLNTGASFVDYTVNLTCPRRLA